MQTTKPEHAILLKPRGMEQSIIVRLSSLHHGKEQG